MGYYRQGPPPGGFGTRIGVPVLTPMVRRILIANVTVWLVQFIAWQLFHSAGLQKLFGLSWHLGVVRGFVWQPFTYFWLHSPDGIFHILFNMLVLWMFGGEIERVWGGRAFLRYYLICGVGAGFFILLGDIVTGSPMLTIGASGAVYGLLLAYGVVFAERVVLFMMMFPMKARTLAIVFFVISFFSLFQRGTGGVSHIAHLGGGIVGFIFLKRLWRVREVIQNIRWKLQRRKFKIVDKKDDDRWVN